MKRLLKIVIIALSVAYPFLIYWGLQHYQASKLLPLLLVLLGLRWLSGSKTSERMVLIGILAAVILITLTWGHQLGLKFYPAMVSLGFLVLFAGSLVFPPCIIERFARLQDPDLPAERIVYTVKVTWMWSGFFLINGSISAFTAIWASNEIWTLYNGLISYLLIGTLFAGEWLVRRRVMQN